MCQTFDRIKSFYEECDDKYGTAILYEDCQNKYETAILHEDCNDKYETAILHAKINMEQVYFHPD